MPSVYVIISTAGLTKVGYAQNTSTARMRQLRCPRGGDLSLVDEVVFDDRSIAQNVETCAHRRLRLLCPKELCNEWYDISHQECADVVRLSGAKTNDEKGIALYGYLHQVLLLRVENFQV